MRSLLELFLKPCCLSRRVVVIVALTLVTPSMTSTAMAQGSCNQPSVDPVTEFKFNGTPRFALSSSDGCWIFVQVPNFRENNTTTDGIAVLRRDSGAIKLARYQPIPGLNGGNMAFTRNQEMIIAKEDRQLVFLDVSALTSGSGKPIRGYISDVHFSNRAPGGQMSLSRDGRYLFVTQSFLAWISIIDLQKVEAGIFGPEAIAGGFPTEDFPSAIVVAPDEKHLFFLSHPPPSVDSSLKCRDYFSSSVKDPLVDPAAAISAANISKALSNPNTAPEIVAAVSAVCSTLIAALDGKTLYTVSHTDNTLVAFDVRPFLEGGKAPTLIGTVPVGRQPRDLVVVDGGKRVIVANSNQFSGTVADRETLTVIDATKIASGAEAVLGNIRVGADPRHVTVTADGRTLLVSNIKSRTLQLIDLERIPLEPVSSESKK